MGNIRKGSKQRSGIETNRGGRGSTVEKTKAMYKVTLIEWEPDAGDWWPVEERYLFTDDEMIRTRALIERAIKDKKLKSGLVIADDAPEFVDFKDHLYDLRPRPVKKRAATGG
jgi:hypothetical protein